MSVPIVELTAEYFFLSEQVCVKTVNEVHPIPGYFELSVQNLSNGECIQRIKIDLEYYIKPIKYEINSYNYKVDLFKFLFNSLSLGYMQAWDYSRKMRFPIYSLNSIGYELVSSISKIGEIHAAFFGVFSRLRELGYSNIPSVERIPAWINTNQAASTRWWFSYLERNDVKNVIVIKGKELKKWRY